ncbi:hypothetical protein ANN_02055 [Periplaneta americana]|uniref:Uncharacterized protein n=1 Tax=Periplaneta americana TaxID=6978 RepID=A0ABQ8TV70_PERAM|nr:hypothetical protein ANN_02055 [Periplaneta americana]
MSPGSSTESYPAFARIGLRKTPEKTSTRKRNHIYETHYTLQCLLHYLKTSNATAVVQRSARTIRLQSHGCGKPRKKPKTKGGSNPSPNAAPDQQPSESAD